MGNAEAMAISIIHDCYESYPQVKTQLCHRTILDESIFSRGALMELARRICDKESTDDVTTVMEKYLDELDMFVTLSHPDKREIFEYSWTAVSNVYEIWRDIT